MNGRNVAFPEKLALPMPGNFPQENSIRTVNDLKEKIRDIPDFPQKGVLFKDITPLLKDPACYRRAVELIASRYRDQNIDLVVGVEARGFILGAPVAYDLGAGIVPVRKPGKLPYRTLKASYQLEYGTDDLEVHQDAVQPGDRVLIVDDLLATGGTVGAVISLVEQLEGKIIGVAFLVELTFFEGRKKLCGYETFSLIQF